MIKLIQSPILLGLISCNNFILNFNKFLIHYRESQNNSNNNSFSNLQNKQYDSNSPSFRFRRHSSQSAINVNSSLPCGSNSSFTSTNERICSVRKKK